jgi:Kef-type K+ transport system membrane component KefB
MSPFEVSMRLFLAIAVILAACRAVGWLARFAGQPQVVAEMVAGLLLGPSLLGLVWPTGQAWLFPADLRPVIVSLSQVGIALYMFMVGLEFRADLFRERLRSAAAISVSGCVVPFALGGLLAWGLAGNATYFGAGVTTLQACLFMGAAMSITAFPMLARIIAETGMTGTRLGTVVLGAGAANDGIAWVVMAVVLGTFSADAGMAVRAVVGGVLYVGLVLVVLRPVLRRLAAGRVGEGPQWPVGPARFSVVLILLTLGAWFTDTIGMHAVFGAFFLGVAMPRGPFVLHLQRMIGPITSGLLVPLFFVYSGLNTTVGVLNTWALWGMALVVLAAACVGKFVACAAAAKLSGEPWRASLAIGALMNARGLMELIILNIGLEQGIITPTMFAIGVVMAIVTTLMATPLFNLIYGRARAAVQSAACPQAEVEPKLGAVARGDAPAERV